MVATSNQTASSQTAGSMGKELAEALPRFEALLSNAKDDFASATTDQRAARAKVEIFQGAVDIARGHLLPAPCQQALKLLVDHASDQWLDDHPSANDPWRRESVQGHIEAQLLATLFRPDLDQVDASDDNHRPQQAAHPAEALEAAKGSVP